MIYFLGPPGGLGLGFKGLGKQVWKEGFRAFGVCRRRRSMKGRSNPKDIASVSVWLGSKKFIMEACKGQKDESLFKWLSHWFCLRQGKAAAVGLVVTEQPSIQNL